MHLNDREIAAIARWTPIDETFASIAQSATDAILRQIGESEAYSHSVFESGGLSNYLAFLVCQQSDLIHRPRETYRQLTPVAVNLSLCAPVGVIGRTSASYGTEFCAIDYLDLNNLIEPSAPESEMEEFVIEVLAASCFTLMSPDDVSRPLPAGVSPSEYCIAAEPWDKHFHALFANTD